MLFLTTLILVKICLISSPLLSSDQFLLISASGIHVWFPLILKHYRPLLCIPIMSWNCSLYVCSRNRPWVCSLKAEIMAHIMILVKYLNLEAV